MNFIRLALWSSRTAVCVALTCADPGVDRMEQDVAIKDQQIWVPFLRGSLQFEASKMVNVFKDVYSLLYITWYLLYVYI